MKQSLLYIILFISGVAFQVSGQEQIEALTVKNGLSQGFVTSIIQDSRGFIWIGTFDGLNRFDGYHIRRFINRPFDLWALRTSSITCLYEDSRQLIWVGTLEGLYVFDPFSERFLFLSVPELHLPASQVESVTGKSSGEVFIQFKSSEEHSRIAEITLGKDIHFDHLSNQHPGFLAKNVQVNVLWDEDGTLLPCIGDSMVLAVDKTNNIYRLNQATRQFQPYDVSVIPHSNTSDNNILRGKYINYCYRYTDANGADHLLPFPAWEKAFRTSGGDLLIWYDSRGPLYKKNNQNPVHADFSRPKNELLNDPVFQQEFTLLSKEQINHTSFCLVDRSDIFWSSTTGWGALKMNLKQLLFQRALAGKSISTMRELPNGLIWLRTYSDEEFTIDPVSFEPVTPPWKDMPKNSWFYDLYADRNGGYWFFESQREATQNQPLIYLPHPGARPVRIPVVFPYQEGVTEFIYEDRSGNIWAGGNDGVLLRIKPGGISYDQLSYKQLVPEDKRFHLRTTAIAQDPFGDIWIGCNRGLIHIKNPESSNPTFECFFYEALKTGTLSSDWVTCICPDPKDSVILWVGTKGGGLNRFSLREKSFICINQDKNEFPDNIVYGVLPDNEGNLWCSTNHGICCYNPQLQTFATYLEPDGLLSTEFNTRSFLRTRDGRLWFGGVNGLNVFRPESLGSNRPAPAIALTEIKVQGQTQLLNREQKLQLAAEENNISIEFSVMDFTNIETNRYRYRLKGVNKTWVSAGNSNVANFAALTPGHYLFEVQGETANGAWSESCLLEFEILPPWYESNLAWFCYLLVIVGAIVGYIRYREKLIKLEHRAEANRLESERLKAFGQVKNQFFANIAHELRTPLTVITGLANRIKKTPSDKETPDNAEHILRQSETLLHLSSQVLDLARLDSLEMQLQPVNGDICSFIRLQVNSIEPLAAGKGVSISMALPQEGIFMDFDPHQLQKVMNNLLNNAIRHTPSTGKVEISAQIAGSGYLKMEINDTGEGILPEDLPHVFDRFYQSRQINRMVGASGIGLTLTRDLVKLMRGTITVESQPGKGASFTIFLPIENKATKDIAGNLSAPPAPGVSAGLPQYGDQNTDLPILLIVDDNPDIQAFLQICLHEHYQLHIASNGDEGIKKALELIPDLILTDAAMPEKSGYDLTEALKSDERTNHIPIVMLTARVENNDRLLAHAKGVNAFLTKPFLEEELLLILRNLMQLQAELKHRYSQIMLQPEADFDPEHDQQKEDAFMEKMLVVFEGNYKDESFNLEKLCQILNISSSQLDRKMKALAGQSPMQMLRRYRLGKAQQLIRNIPGISIKEVCFQTGFKSPAHFSRLYAAEFGVPPSKN